ncbi:nuclear envelope pore membrane protein POM 121 [Brachypodium distachyon]|uniref:VQ domain-containing protein n=1 Tax=Brachypodium distachyon TaxID=15368 RepID=I1I6Y5_BRADI|nr:nuclear envelope pore membrane protein POM 121 [Brachypodium distachyon]KQJ98225.1 hypothetical protein BRADI_3g35600v3 [Brachypodium distachyon]|eukprot:XP_014755829.1 nuclear envelope pore membrane protein POM 121 [Brachypodium distachyon]
MESGNSGSLQSSSCGGGGEEEFDSRCADSSSPLSALLRQSTAGFVGGGSFYGLRHELETPSSLPPLPQAAHHWSPALPAVPAGSTDGASPSSSSSHGVPPAASAVAPGQQQQQAASSAAAAAARGSRKRTRASRRAPTTVLTTDTSNFRAMVQEFTGVPSPPFAPTASSRFDHLFRSSPNNPAASSFPPYLLRPFARQKHHQQAHQPSSIFPSSSSFAMPSPSSIGGTAPPVVTAACASSSVAAMASGGSYQYHHSASPAALLGSRDHHYLSSFQSPLAAPGATHPMFDTLSVPPMRPQEEDPVAGSFLGRTHHHGILATEGTHLHLHPRVVDHGRRRDEDELSGLVGSGVCRTTTIYSSSVPGAEALAAPRLLDRNVDSTTSATATTTAATTTVAGGAAMRTQGVDSWICTSDQ